MTIDKRKTLIKDFKNQIKENLGENVLNNIEKRLTKDYEGTLDLETTDEWFTALSDVIEDKTNPITYDSNKSFYDNIKENIAKFLNKNTPYENLSIETGQDAYNFMKEYSKSVKAGKLSESIVKFAETGKTTPIKEAETKFSKNSKVDVDNLGKMGWNDKTWKESGAKFAIETIKDEKLFDALIYSKYKVENVPANFVNDVITALTPDIKKFNSSYTNKKTGKKVEAKWGTEQENNSLFGYLQGLVQYRADDVYKELYKGDEAIKGAKNIGETTKEGEVKIQVAAETDTAMER